MMNKNARAKIVTTTVGNMRYTDTMDRDYGAPNVSIETEKLGTGSRTRLTMMGFGGVGCKVNLDLNGHEARTLYRVLEKHYGYVGALKAARADKDEWREVAENNAGEKLRLNLELARETLSHMRTRRMLDDLGESMLKIALVEMPAAMDLAYEAGKQSMLEPARAAAKIAFRAGMTKGFKAAQQLELFSDLGLPSL
jgi:hypothetical protein